MCRRIRIQRLDVIPPPLTDAAAGRLQLSDNIMVTLSGEAATELRPPRIQPCGLCLTNHPVQQVIGHKRCLLCNPIPIHLIEGRVASQRILTPGQDEVEELAERIVHLLQRILANVVLV